MHQALTKFVLDAVYIVLFFSIMSAAALGAGLILRLCEALGLDPIVVMILRVLEVILAVLDAVGVIMAAIVLLRNFALALTATEQRD
jgi:hypothetical protein